jgi:ribosomal protein L35AE/L33A
MSFQTCSLACAAQRQRPSCCLCRVLFFTSLPLSSRLTIAFSGRHTQHMGTSLIKIEGVNDKKDTAFYLGKRVCYVYRASRKQQDRQGVQTTVRSIWGRVSKAHGNGGTVRAVFDTKCVSVSTHINESLSFAALCICLRIFIRLCFVVTFTHSTACLVTPWVLAFASCCSPATSKYASSY